MVSQSRPVGRGDAWGRADHFWGFLNQRSHLHRTDPLKSISERFGGTQPHFSEEPNKPPHFMIPGQEQGDWKLKCILRQKRMSFFQAIKSGTNSSCKGSWTEGAIKKATRMLPLKFHSRNDIIASERARPSARIVTVVFFPTIAERRILFVVTCTMSHSCQDNKPSST